MSMAVDIPNFSASIFRAASSAGSVKRPAQLTPDFEMGEYKRQNLVYEKEDLLIDGSGKYPDYNFYRVSGLAIGGKDKGQAEHESAPVDVKSLMP
jgi:NADH-quinone oxidoreductase subunit I